MNRKSCRAQDAWLLLSLTARGFLPFAGRFITKRLMVLIGACCVVLSSCTWGEEYEEEQPLPDIIMHQTRIRAVFAPCAGADCYEALWSPGDRIGVFVLSDETYTAVNVPLIFEGGQSAAAGFFTGEIPIASKASRYTLYAYYPYMEQAGTDPETFAFKLPAQQLQAAGNDSSHLGALDFRVSETVKSTSGDFPPLVFHHAFSVVEVDLTGAGEMAGKQLSELTLYCTDASMVDMNGQLSGTSNMAGDFSFDLRTGKAVGMLLDPTGAAQTDYCSLRYAEPPTLGTATLKSYLVVNPADYSVGEGRIYVALRTTDGYTATFSQPGPVLAAGQAKVLAHSILEGVAPQSAIDLSGSGQRANCYVASVAGQLYTFDATVAGNGVITPDLQQAVQTFEGRTLSSSLSGVSARLMWQSAPRLIDPASVRYQDGRVRFALSTRPPELGGNAVIGLFGSYDSAAEPLWSWHIWVTDKSNDALIALSETYILYADYEAEYGSYASQMMDRNLGAVYKEDGAYARSFRAPLYQWGRKDPMPWGLAVYDAQNTPHRYITYRPPVLSTGSQGQYVGYTGNTHYATAHPDTFIATTAATSYDWYYGGGAGTTTAFRNNSLWGNPTGYEVGMNTTKTLFDPCPAGWKVPHPYIFSGFTKTGETTSVASGETTVAGQFVQGWNFYYDSGKTTYYPGVGFRFDEAGLFAFTPAGYYWSSAPAPSSTFGAWMFSLTATTVFQRISDPRGFGLPVRCMRDLPAI